MDEDEPLDKAAARELQEETSVNPSDVLLSQASSQSMMHAEQFRFFSALSRTKLSCDKHVAPMLNCVQMHIVAQEVKVQTEEFFAQVLRLALCGMFFAGWGIWGPRQGSEGLVCLCGLCSTCAIHQHGRQSCSEFVCAHVC